LMAETLVDEKVAVTVGPSVASKAGPWVVCSVDAMVGR